MTKHFRVPGMLAARLEESGVSVAAVLRRAFPKDFFTTLASFSRRESFSRSGNRSQRSVKVERLHGQRFETIRQAKDETLDWLLV